MEKIDSSQPLVSVVTPVYNGEDYLSECIESVLNQTFTNWEYIIVNNCSNDKSPAIAKCFAEKDNRIKLIHNEKFLNQIENLNNSLQYISPGSKYCKFVLADDWIYPECIEKMVSLAERYQSISIVSAYRFRGNEVSFTGLPYDKCFFSGRDIAREYLLHRRDYFGSETSVLFRSKDIRGKTEFFNEDEVHTDTSKCLELLINTDFGFVHQILTFTRVENESTRKFTKYYNTSKLYHVKFILKYGSYYLNEFEYKVNLKRSIVVNYRRLIKSTLDLRGFSIWRYHISKYREYGVPFRKFLFIKAIVLELFSPLQNLGIFIAALKRIISNDSERRRIIELKKNTTTN